MTLDVSFLIEVLTPWPPHYQNDQEHNSKEKTKTTDDTEWILEGISMLYISDLTFDSSLHPTTTTTTADSTITENENKYVLQPPVSSLLQINSTLNSKINNNIDNTNGLTPCSTRVKFNIQPCNTIQNEMFAKNSLKEFSKANNDLKYRIERTENYLEGLLWCLTTYLKYDFIFGLSLF